MNYFASDIADKTISFHHLTLVGIIQRDRPKEIDTEGKSLSIFPSFIHHLIAR